MNTEFKTDCKDFVLWMIKDISLAAYQSLIIAYWMFFLLAALDVAIPSV